MRWRVIEYREFHDVPRMIIAANEEGTFLFYSRFNEEADEYSTQYEVYCMPQLSRDIVAGSWEGLERRAVERRANIRVTDLPFQVERRDNESAV